MTVTTVYSRLHQLELELAYHQRRMARAAKMAQLTGDLQHEQAHEYAAADAQNVADEIEHLKLVLSAHEPEEEMPTVSEIYPSEWLKAADLAGRAVTVTIASVEVRSFDARSGKEEKKLVVSFTGAQKRLVCNVTQARAIAAAAGSDDTDNWPGTRIQLRPDRTKQNQDTITVSAAPARQPAAEQQ